MLIIDIYVALRPLILALTCGELASRVGHTSSLLIKLLSAIRSGSFVVRARHLGLFVVVSLCQIVSHDDIVSLLILQILLLLLCCLPISFMVIRGRHVTASSFRASLFFVAFGMLESATIVLDCEQVFLALNPSDELVRDGLRSGSLFLILLLSLLYRGLT